MDPYSGVDVALWKKTTEELVRKHPLTPVIVNLCIQSWESILNGKINTYLNLKIKEMNISPQATGALLHDIVPEYISRKGIGFRKGAGDEKDIVCEYDDFFSIELKTSSQKSIYGNRSYAKSQSGKSKAGYYLAINFEKIAKTNPRIRQIGFGWLDHSDWVGQKSETGQRALLTREAKANKFIVLYSANDVSK